MVLWWCTPCQEWREPVLVGTLGHACPQCRSGRIRPPMPGEVVPQVLPPIPAAQVRAELDA